MRAPPAVVKHARATAESGFTLVEIVVVIAIIATTAAAGLGISLASRSFAVSAAATEFDHLLDSARTIARETAGATLVFAPDAYGDGTEVRVLAPGPNATLVATAMPIMHTHAAIEETQSLGKAPFAFVIHTSGALGGRPGFRLGDSTATGEVGCPPSGSFHFVIHTAGTSAERLIPCRIALAATGPVALASWPPAAVAPAPTPCSGPCTPAALPTAPSASPSCPPNYAPTPGGCTPTPSGSAPHYHVTATLASPTMTVGGTDTLTAQATLVNPTTAPPGTPTSIPVIIQQITTAICSAERSAPESALSHFILGGVASGRCTIEIQGDTTMVPGAATDSVSLEVDTSAPNGPPSPPPCDLTLNAKCYGRIVSPSMQTIWKHVVPANICGNQSDDSCHYVDTIEQVFIEPGIGVQPPLPADASHELLFQIDAIAAALYSCQPFAFFESIPVGSSIPWGGFAISSGADGSLALGEPSSFLAMNHVLDGSAGAFREPSNGWSENNTFEDLYSSVAHRIIGSRYQFTYSSDQNTNGSVQWYPDFPSCDVPGSFNASGAEYGSAGISLIYEVYQAIR